MSGGFFPESSSQNVNSPAKSKGNLGPQSMRPVTIKQLQDCEMAAEGRFVADGTDLSQFSFVGCIRSIKTLNTGTDYLVEDGTSSINARCWDDKKMDSVRDGDWVRVYGILKALGNSKIVTIFALTKIVDFNEVTYHFLDAMQAHMTFTKPVIHEVNRAAGGEVRAPAATAYSFKEDQNLTPIQKAVFDMYASFHDEAGLHTAAVIRAMHGRYSENDVRNAVNKLVSDGLIYFTIDSDHARNVAA